MSINFENQVDAYLEKEFPNLETSIFRDLALNFKKLMTESTLEPRQRWMTALAVSTSLGDQSMAQLSVQCLKELDVAQEQICESSQVAAIMGMNNVYYKFRHYLADEAKDLYQRAGLRMQSLGKPITGKETFEMLSLAVSAVNGCPSCIASHERALTALSVEADKIHDSVRIASVLKGLHSLSFSVKFLKV